MRVLLRQTYTRGGGEVRVSFCDVGTECVFLVLETSSKVKAKGETKKEKLLIDTYDKETENLTPPAFGKHLGSIWEAFGSFDSLDCFSVRGSHAGANVFF